MGLDMYLEGEKFYTTNWQNPEKNLQEDGFRLMSKELRLGYWRKHPNLHGYIVSQFADGKDDCQEIELSDKDVDNIIHAVKNDLLPHTEGFFFGTSEETEERKAEDISILEGAKKWLSEKQEGVWKSIKYQASW